MNKKILLLIATLLFSLAAIFFLYQIGSKSHKLPDMGVKIPDIKDSFSQKNKEGFLKFESKEDLIAYLEKASKKSESLGDIGMLGRTSGEPFSSGVPSPVFMSSEEKKFDSGLATREMSQTPSRASETNVQVLGIDEPDIVKTDGNNIYFSQENHPVAYRGVPLPQDSVAWDPHWPRYEEPKTKIIKAFPVGDLAKIGSIDKNGQLLLSQNKKILVIIRNQEIFGYDVSDPKNPKEKWNVKLADKSALVGSRLEEDTIYLVTRNYLDRHDPCPIRPMMIGSQQISIGCEEIYHPKRIIPSDASFVAMSLDIGDGKVKEKTSFIGSSSSSQIYMSEKAIFVAYAFMEDIFGFLTKAMTEVGKELLPNHILEKMNKIKDYDLSDQAKMTEFVNLMENYAQSLSKDEELKMENEIGKRLGDYYKEHSRELKKTGIVKIDSDKLSVSASGNIPGHLLNQFSLDEYKGNLRVATTVGDDFWGWRWGLGGESSSANDIYVLDKNLEVIGSVKDLGVTERIYSARFLGDRGYLVTFRQIDPFYVLDLSNPKKPEMKGELKIPGYSSYLHPLADNIILGIGQEEGKVKLSLFDVKNPSDPREIDKYLLSEYWSEAQNNHHAFLQDNKHEIFFLPGGKGGYVFSYSGNKLSLKKAVSDYQVKRAVYIDDYLYIIGEKKISVLDEKSWEKVKELDI